ncbi:hypothetical protein GCM10009765_54700 [Fodinicola feengrottensis]|uniref:Uncharacterized protein n=1 Tax=Fodinicola feengrottensis TaxID=435914 RepID=A0ABP4U345_9ACTN
MSEHVEYDSSGNQYDVYEHSDGSADVYEYGADGVDAHDSIDADGAQHVTATDGAGDSASENVNSDGTVSDVHESSADGYQADAYNNYNGTYTYDSN